MASHFALRQNQEGEIFFNFLNKDNEVVLQSGNYPDKSSAEEAIKEVRVNSLMSQQLAAGKTPAGEQFFVIKGSTGNPLVKSALYTSQMVMDNALHCVKDNACVADVMDLTWQMGLIFKINQELATVLATEIELLSISRTITTLITNQEFLRLYKGIVSEINNSYTVINDTFSPFYQLDDEEKFRSFFSERHAAFKGSYLMDVSKPRRHCDNVYDAYIQMQQTKEAKIGYPLLKATFTRLDELYDKWITNDAFMAMSIDGVLKKLNLILNEIAELKTKDEEDAYIVFSSGLEDFRDLLTLIQTNNEKLSQLTGG